MIRTNSLRLAVALVVSSGMVLAQTPPSGGWRRVGDPPPAPATAPPPAPQNPAATVPAKPAPAPPEVLDQDPSQPVDRTDAYGQPAQTPPPVPQDQYPQGPPPQGPPPQGYPQQGPPPEGYPQQGYPPQGYSQGRAPQGSPAYAVPPELTVRPGTYVTIRINEPLSSDHNQPGDVFTGSLAQPLVVDGVVLAQRGQNVFGRVAEAQHARSDRPSRLGLELTGITLADGNQISIRSQLIGRQGGRTPTGDQIGTVAATTGAGAVIGGMIGWGTGAAVGAGVGAAAGLIGVIATRNHPTVVYPETPLTFAISQPITVSTAAAPYAFHYVGPDEYDHQMNAHLQPRPVPVRPYYYGPGYPYAYGYPYPYYGWGPGVTVVWGRGPGYYWGRGYYRRWR